MLRAEAALVRPDAALETRTHIPAELLVLLVLLALRWLDDERIRVLGRRRLRCLRQNGT